MRVRVRHGRSFHPVPRLRGGFAGVLLGIVLLLFGWRWHARTQAYVARSVETVGRVVEVVSQTETRGGERRTLYYPVVEFIASSGQTIRFQDRTGSNPPAYRGGETVQVRYDPRTPQDAMIASWANLWLPSTILLAAGGASVLLGAWVLLRALFFLAGAGGLLGAVALLLGRDKPKPR